MLRCRLTKEKNFLLLLFLVIYCILFLLRKSVSEGMVQSWFCIIILFQFFSFFFFLMCICLHFREDKILVKKQ